MKKRGIIKRKASRTKATGVALAVAPIVAQLLESYFEVQIPQDVLVSLLAGIAGVGLWYLRDAVNRPGGDDPEELAGG